MTWRKFNHATGFAVFLFALFGGFHWLGKYWPDINTVTKDQLMIVLGAAIMWSNKPEKKP